MSSKEEVKILAIESSCDETAAAVVVNGREVRSDAHILPDRTAYAVWRSGAGDCVA